MKKNRIASQKEWPDRARKALENRAFQVFTDLHGPDLFSGLYCVMLGRLVQKSQKSFRKIVIRYNTSNI